jgi:DNA invertase Pin-like site-specific DNA recombinase
MPASAVRKVEPNAPVSIRCSRTRVAGSFRSLIDLLGTIQHLEAVGVDLYLDQQSIDTTTPMGKLVFQVTGAFAELERSIIRQRIKIGLKRAVAQGARLGRTMSVGITSAAGSPAADRRVDAADRKVEAARIRAAEARKRSVARPQAQVCGFSSSFSPVDFE